MGALTVRITDSYTDRYVTPYVTNLRFRKVAPGGHTDATLELDMRTSAFPDLGPNDRLRIYDAQTGQCIYSGYINNPGTETGETGQRFQITAQGAFVRAKDQREAAVYIDRQLNSLWKRGGNTLMLSSSTAEASTAPDTDTAALLLQFNPGQALATGDFAQMVYDLRPLGGRIGGFNATFHGGRTDAGFQYRYGFDPGTYTVTWNLTTASNTSGRLAITHYPAGAGYVAVRLLRAGAPANVTTDDVWVALDVVAVCGQLVDRYGTDIVCPSVDYVVASTVVEDLLGRLLKFCEPTTAVVDATTFQIDQLAYTSAVTAAQILDDLLQIHPERLYEFNEDLPNGKHQFAFRAWPTTARYLIPPSMPIEQPGSDNDLCNRAVVNWTDAKGNPQVTVRGLYVPQLGDRNPVLGTGKLDPAFVGRVRDADEITLPEGKGSLANAQRIGDQVLAGKAAAGTAGRVTVDQPIVDRDRGEMAPPHRLLPGYVARAVATGEDYQVTSVEYDHSSGTAVLELGTPRPTPEQRIARLRSVR